jgi:hypothetical protein
VAQGGEDRREGRKRERRDDEGQGRERQDDRREDVRP